MARNKSTLDLKTIAESAKQEVVEAQQDPVALPSDDKRIELTPEQITFDIAYDGPDGEDYSSVLTSKIMNADGRLAKARVMAQLNHGINPDALTQEDRYRVEALSRISIQLVEPPKWIYDYTGSDMELLVHINNILMEHENRYFRGNAREDQEGQVKARVRSVVSAFNKNTTPDN